MEVILLDKVANLGSLGDQVKVRPGYGRNFLIPRGKAVMATAENQAKFEERRQELEKQAAEAVAAAEARAEKLADLVVEITSRAGDEGKLFGSIGTNDIAEAAAAASGVELGKHEVRLPEGALRHTGEFEVALQLHADVATTIKVNIVPEA